MAVAILLGGPVAVAQTRQPSGIPLIRNYDIADEFSSIAVTTLLRP